MSIGSREEICRLTPGLLRNLEVKRRVQQRRQKERPLRWQKAGAVVSQSQVKKAFPGRNHGWQPTVGDSVSSFRSMSATRLSLFLFITLLAWVHFIPKHSPTPTPFLVSCFCVGGVHPQILSGRVIGWSAFCILACLVMS